MTHLTSLTAKLLQNDASICRCPITICSVSHMQSWAAWYSRLNAAVFSNSSRHPSSANWNIESLFWLFICARAETDELNKRRTGRTCIAYWAWVGRIAVSWEDVVVLAVAGQGSRFGRDVVNCAANRRVYTWPYQLLKLLKEPCFSRSDWVETSFFTELIRGREAQIECECKWLENFEKPGDEGRSATTSSRWPEKSELCFKYSWSLSESPKRSRGIVSLKLSSYSFIMSLSGWSYFDDGTISS